MLDGCLVRFQPVAPRREWDPGAGWISFQANISAPRKMLTVQTAPVQFRLGETKNRTARTSQRCVPGRAFCNQRMGGIIVAYVRCQIKDYKNLMKRLNGTKKAPRKVLNALMSDARKKVPGWVSTEVTKVYGIKKADVPNKIGSLKVVGDSIKDLKFIYAGRKLTPAHFNMAPKTPNPGGSYTLKATSLKGKRSTLGKVKKLTKKQRASMAKNFTRSGSQKSSKSPIMLMHTGNTQAGGVNYIPFQRVSKDRKDVIAIKPTSLKQMIENKKTAEGISKAINEGLGKRLDHHMQRYMGK